MKKENRIKKSEEIVIVVRHQLTEKTKYFNIYYLKTTANLTRVAISVSSKIGNAVARNKIKRQINAVLQTSLDLKLPLDLVIVAKKDFDISNFKSMKETLEAALISIRRKINE